jgi:hypothetical protein
LVGCESGRIAEVEVSPSTVVFSVHGASRDVGLKSNGIGTERGCPGVGESVPTSRIRGFRPSAVPISAEPEQPGVVGRGFNPPYSCEELPFGRQGEYGEDDNDTHDNEAL